MPYVGIGPAFWVSCSHDCDQCHGLWLYESPDPADGADRDVDADAVCVCNRFQPGSRSAATAAAGPCSNFHFVFQFDHHGQQ